MNNQQKPHCLFCEIVSRKKNAYIIAENEEVIAILDKFPASDGHTLLITKKHFPNISKIEEESWNYLWPLMKDIINKLESVFKPQGFNFISNMNENMEKKVAYQSIPHFHLHIIPKYVENEGFIWAVKSQLKYNLEEVVKKLK